MAGKNWMSKLRQMESAVVGEYDRFAHVIETPSPSVNFSFGRGGGLPLGFSAVFFGPPKGGKTLLANATAGNLHRTYEDGIVVKFDTEMREEGQLTDKEAGMWGIDRDRYQCYSTNNPMRIFDRISNEFAGMCQEGMPLKLIIIDSLNGIRGRRSLNTDTIETQQMGDDALTIQTGLKQILEFQRKFNVALILTCHVRAEMDTLEQKRGNKTRMAASFGTQHHAEYFLYIERNRNAAARKSLTGEAFVDDKTKNEVGGADAIAHKIHTVMKANSMGPAGRVGEFTLDYQKGIVNVHEEVYLLCKNRGIIERPSNVMYRFEGKEWRGEKAMVTAIAESPELQAALMKELKKADAEGRFRDQDLVVAEAPDLDMVDV